MEGDQFHPVSAFPGHSRKRQRDRANWAVTQKKLRLHGGGEKTPKIERKHSVDLMICNVSRLTPENLNYVYPLMYQDGDKI